MDQRSHHVKLGYCDKNPRTIWRKYKKGDTSMIVPMILGRTRRALKFMNAGIKKYLSTSDLCTIVLDSNNAGKDDRKECDSS